MSFLVNPFIFASAGDAVFGQATFTVASSEVASDLTDYPLALELNDLGDSFWDAVDEGGGNIRVYSSDGTTLIPHDVTMCDTWRRKGRVVCKITLSSTTDTSVVLKLLSSGASALAVDNANGRNNVWSDFNIVYIGPDGSTNRTGNSFTQNNAASVLNHGGFIRDAYYASSDTFQGVAGDATHLIVMENAQLTRRLKSSPQSVVTTNATPFSSFGGSANKFGDGVIVDGSLYVVANNGAANNAVIKYNATTLAYEDEWILGDVFSGDTIESIGWDGTDFFFVPFDLAGVTTLYKYTTSFVANGTVTLSDSMAEVQGVEYIDGRYVVAEGATKEYWEFESDGSNGRAFINDRPSTGDTAGVYWDATNKILWTGDADGDLYEFDADRDQFDYSKLHFVDFRTYDTTRPTIWTMGGSFVWSHVVADRTATQAGFMAIKGATIAANNDGALYWYDDGPDDMGIFLGADGWQYPTPLQNPQAGYDWFRLNAKQNGTTEFKGFFNSTDATVTLASPAQQPSGTGTDSIFSLGGNNITAGDATEFYFQYAYTRHSYLSDDWIDFEYRNWHDYANTVTVVEEDGDTTGGISYVAALRATLSANQTGISGSFADNLIDWDTEDLDDNWGWDPGTSSGTFTVPSGTNFVTVSAFCRQVADGSLLDARIIVRLDGVDVGWQSYEDQFRQDTKISVTFAATAGQEIEVYLQTNDTENILAVDSFVSLTAFGTV